MILEEYRKEMSSIDMFNNLIFIHQQGIGKSYNAMKTCNNRPDIARIAVITKNHALINEYELGVRNLTHWYGIEHLCKKPNIKQLTKLGIGAPIICPGCPNVETCQYILQFTKRYRVGMPIEHMKYSSYMYPLHEGVYYPFKLIILEEANIETIDYVLDEEKILEGFSTLSMYTYRDPQIEAYLEEGRLSWEKKIGVTVEFNYIDTLWNHFKNKKYSKFFNLDFLSTIKNTILRNLYKEEDWEAIKEVQKLDISNLEGWIRYENIYRYEYKSYHEPYIFKAFDMQRLFDTKVVILQASLEEHIFNGLLNRYEHETGFRPKFEIHRSNLQNKNTKVYQITNRGFSDTKWDDNLPFIDTSLEKIIKIYGINNIGVIAHKEYIQKSVINKKEYFMRDFDAMGYGATAGLNLFVDKPTLILIGTFMIPLDAIVKKYNQLFVKNIDGKIEGDKMKSDHDNGKFPNLFGTTLEWMEKAMQTNYITDCGHRNRGLISNKTIFFFGITPEDISKTFKFEIIEPKDVDARFFQMRIPKIVEVNLNNNIFDGFKLLETLNTVSIGSKYMRIRRAKFKTVNKTTI